MSVTYVVVTVVLKDRALVTDGRAVSPHTLDHLPAPAIRGMLASVCTDAEIDLLIAGEAVLSAPGLPIMRIPRTGSDPADTVPVQAYPVPRTTVGLEDDFGFATVADARTVASTSGVRIFPVSGAMVCSPAADVDAQPGSVPTSTHQRLQRSRPPGTAPGPFTETVLEPGTWFEIRLRIADHVDDPGPVVETLEAVLARPTLRIGSGAYSAYGGDLQVKGVEPVTDRPWSQPSRATTAGQPVHLVSVTPALVRDRHTGEYDPAALPDHVAEMLSAAIGSALEQPVRVTTCDPAPSIGSVRVGGFHRGYKGLRPEHWAAAAGSVVTVTTDVPVPGPVWDQALGQRVGERTVDGFGLLRIDPAPTNWNEKGAPRYSDSHDETRVVRLADGTVAPAADHTDPDVRHLRHILFRNGADDAIADLAVLLARRSERIPGNSTLARVRAALPAASWDIDAARHDLAAAHALLGSFTSGDVPDTARPAAAALTACVIRWDTATTWTLLDVLTELTASDYDPATSILRRTLDPAGDLGAGLTLPAALVKHRLSTGDPAQVDVAAWIDEQQLPLRHALAANLLHALRTGKEPA